MSERCKTQSIPVLGASPVHAKALEAARVLANWGRDIGHGKVSTMACDLASELAEQAQQLVLSDEKNTRDIGVRLVAIVEALRGQSKGGR